MTGADRARRRVLTVLALVGAALALGLTVVAGWAAPAAAAVPSPAAGPTPVVVVGVPGLRWSEVGPAATPALWRLAGRASLGTAAIRSAADTTCPGDGWVMLGAGNRAAGPAASGAACAPLPAVRGAGGGGPATVAGWAGVVRRNARLDFGARPGALAGALRGRGCVAAVGPGAALAAATPAGRVAHYWARVGPATVAAAAAACPVAVVAAPTLPDHPTTAALHAADDVVAAATAGAPRPASVLVVGIAQAAAGPAHLQVAAAEGARYGVGRLSSGSTRRPPFVQVSDVAPTVLQLRGVPAPAAMDGLPWHAVAGRVVLPAAVRALAGEDRAAQAVRRALPVTLGWLIGLQLAGYGVAAVRHRRAATGGPAAGRPAATVARGAALFALAGPLATYLVQATPWWRAPAPLAVVTAGSVAVAALLAAAAAAGPWRRDPLAAPTALLALTAAVLAGDVITGSRLQLDSVFGYSPVVAGRFVGFGNVAYGVFATAALLSAACLGGMAGGAARSRRWAGGVAGVIGVAAVAVDGTPSWGADIGGTLALVPAVAVLVMLLAGVRLSVRRVVLAGVAAVAVVAVFSLADYARPASAQTHLGRFVGQLLHGDAGTVLRRKAAANLALLTHTPVNAVVPFVTAALAWYVFRPRGRLAAARQRRPAAYAGLVAVVVMAVIGFFTNDSGDAIPAMAMLLAVPFTVHLLAVPERVPAQPDTPAAPAPRPPGQRPHVLP